MPIQSPIVNSRNPEAEIWVLANLIKGDRTVGLAAEGA